MDERDLPHNPPEILTMSSLSERLPETANAPIQQPGPDLKVVPCRPEVRAARRVVIKLGTRILSE